MSEHQKDVPAAVVRRFLEHWAYRCAHDRCRRFATLVAKDAAWRLSCDAHASGGEWRDLPQAEMVRITEEKE